MSVSVVIPCYNQGRFLGEAITSAAQHGLVSGTSVRSEKGLSEARNSGWRAPSSDYIVFLDADDRLRPGAIDAGASEALPRWPHAAFVVGHYELIDELGAIPPTWRELRVAHDRTFTTGDFELVLADRRRASILAGLSAR